VVEALAVIEQLDERISALDRELLPLAAADPRVQLLDTIPGIGPCSASRSPQRSATSAASPTRAS
jgi:transposase